MQIEPDRNTLLRNPYPDRLQQIINRLRKQFEHLGPVASRLRIVQEIEKMNLTEAERCEILRRIR